MMVYGCPNLAKHAKNTPWGNIFENISDFILWFNHGPCPSRVYADTRVRNPICAGGIQSR